MQPIHEESTEKISSEGDRKEQAREKGDGKSKEVKGKEKGRESRVTDTSGDGSGGTPINIKSPTVDSVLQSFKSIKKPMRGPPLVASNRFQVLADGGGEEVSDNASVSCSGKEVSKASMDDNGSQSKVSND
ncbi:hypothetical protein L6452_09204 [Arctium lappa]|uniref:Uncharacterized protein n=1 Tax=Arctium lappa TaxID=4217 RepID=A0ACB9DJU2_ARCLA|nr:hypothetical protein L6452_09204 [Arctium lappa]